MNRLFGCFYYTKVNNNKIFNGNTACWAGLNNHIKSKDNSLPIYIKIYKPIELFSEEEFLKHMKRIVYLINLMTPCSLVKEDNKNEPVGANYPKSNYSIKYQLFSSNYYSEIVLLNIIRMLWFIPYNFNILQYYEDIHTKRKKGEDPLTFLLNVISKNVIDVNTNTEKREQDKETGIASYKYGYGDHSLIYKNIKPKPFKHLKESKQNYMQGFLQL